MKKLILTLLCCVAVITASAQVGYQVSLLNTATGEPRSNESVSVTVKITDSAGNVVCEETKQEITNDFGVLSMTVGSQSTFADADWSKLPFYIEATVDDRLIGRSQILSVPVAEHAKHTGVLTKELLCSKTWEKKWTWVNDEGKSGTSYSTVTFRTDGTGSYSHRNDYEVYSGEYIIDGNVVVLIYTNKDQVESYDSKFFYYLPHKNVLMSPYTGEVFE